MTQRLYNLDGNEIEFTATSNLKNTEEGWLDHLQDGYIKRNGEKIPCQLGYAYRGGASTEPAVLFIKKGITAKGNHYESETIEVDRA